MVEEHRGPGGELHAHFHVVAVELAGALIAEAAEEPEHGALGNGGDHQHGRVGEQAADWLAPPGLGELPRRVRGERLLEDRKARLDAPRVRGVGREAEDLADGEGGLPGGVLSTVMPDVEAAQRHLLRRDVGGDLVVADQRFQDEDLGGRAERGHELRGHLLGQLAEVEGVLAGGSGVAQQDVADQGGVDEPLGGRDRDLHDHEGGDIARPGLHRLGSDHGVRAEPAREGDRQHGISLTLGPHRVKQHVYRDVGEPVGRIRRDVA
jgi:hypothetical protein